MTQCKCEHWQQCPVCMPHRFDAEGKLLPPEPTPLQAARTRIAELERLRDVLAKLLCRYRNETPPGHQPHMIAHEVDAALASVKGNAEVTGVTTGENDAT